MTEMTGEGEPNRSAVRWRVGLALKVAVSVGLVWYLVQTISLQELVTRLMSLDVKWAIVAAVLLLSQIVLIGWRWFLVCGRMDIHVPFLALLRFTFEGYFFNQALPSSIGGDAVRIMRLRGRTGQTRAAIESVIIDRALGLVSLAILIGLEWPILDGLVSDPAIKVMFALIVIVGLAGACVFLMLPVLSTPFRKLPLVPDLVRLSHSARKLLLHVSVIPLILISLAGQAVTGVVFWSLAKGLGLELSFVHSIVLVPAALLVTLVPISVAGWGLREGAIVTLLSFAGVPADGALALSILFGLLSLCVSVPGGLLWLTHSPATLQFTRTLQGGSQPSRHAASRLTALRGSRSS